MQTIIDHLTDPIIVSKQMIMYVYSDAFTTCDCGGNLKLSVRRYGSDLYEGSCPDCKKKYEMFLNKIMEVK